LLYPIVFDETRVWLTFANFAFSDLNKLAEVPFEWPLQIRSKRFKNYFFFYRDASVG